MKKSILKNLVILSFALGGLFLVGNNVFGMHEMKDSEDDSGGSRNCTSETLCNQGFGDHGTYTGEILCCQTARVRGSARK
jgi:hypothetical protein